jgi:hypothetical protein
MLNKVNDVRRPGNIAGNVRYTRALHMYLVRIVSSTSFAHKMDMYLVRSRSCFSELWKDLLQYLEILLSTMREISAESVNEN